MAIGKWQSMKHQLPYKWSEDGTGHADFNLVAVYSDVETRGIPRTTRIFLWFEKWTT